MRSGTNNRGLCLRCWSDYQREWRKQQKTRTEAKLLKRGAERMREYAVQAFRGIGNAEMTGHTAAQVMSHLKLES